MKRFAIMMMVLALVPLLARAQYSGVTRASEAEPNDEWTQANTLGSGQTVNAELGKEVNGKTDVVDWYKIEVPEEGSVTFSTTTESTLRLGTMRLCLLNEEGTDLVSRNEKDMDDYGNDTTIVFTIVDVKAGTYYVRTLRYTGYGGYTLKYEFTPCALANDPEPNDEWTKASLIKSGRTNEGRLGYMHTYADVDNDDWYKIEVPEEGSITFSTTAESTLRLGTMRLCLLNEEGTDLVTRNEKDMDDYGNDTTIVFTIVDVKAGTYYVKTHRYTGYGGYKLKYEFTPCALANDPEPNDDWTKASLIESGKTNEGRLGYMHTYADVDNDDWYKIEVPEEGSITFSTTAESTLRLGIMRLCLLNEEGTDLVTRNEKDMDDYGNDTTIVFTIVDVKAGTYYVRTHRYTGYGGYTLKYEFTPCALANDPEPNDVWTQASLLTNGQNQQGRLGYFHTHADMDNDDWYKIELSADGSVTFATRSETTLRLGDLSLCTLNADGTEVNSRNSKDMDAYNKDTTIVFTVEDLAAGTYYVRTRRHTGYGGYTLSYRYSKNPYFREALDNTTPAKALKLEEGKAVSTTLGYRYNWPANEEDWYDLGVHGKEVVDVTIEPDTLRSLVIGLATWYKWDGTYDDNGNPLLGTYIKQDRVERSRITTSYMVNEENVHLFLRVPKYSGWGGYKIVMGEESDGNATDSPLLADGYKGLSLMVGGRNTVRKGVPCENSITISNMSDTPTIPALLLFNFSDDVKLIEFRLPGDRGMQYVPADSILVDYEGAENAALFDIPRLEPWQSYTFYMISEGEGDIAYAPYMGSDWFTTDANGKQQRIVVSATTCVAVGFIVSCVKDMIDDKIGTDALITDGFKATVGLDEKQNEQLRRLYGQTRDQYYEKDPSVAAYVTKSVVKTACVKAIESIPVVGTTISEAGKKVEFVGGLLPTLRRRLWYMIYKDLGYIKDDNNDNAAVVGAKRAINDVVASWDPNEMVGPQGVGDNHYIGQTQTFNYTIMFENKAEAGAPAYRVRISDELDENVFDVSSVKFGITSHDADGYKWEMTRDGNKLSWDIKGIELPPNVNAPEGEGYVTFSVDLKPGLADGTKIANKATIIFDKNFPIETNEFVNTLDLTAPVTTMAQASYDKELGGIKVECNSVDAASGVDSYQLFVSTNGGDYTFAGNFPSTPFYPVAESDGITYGFYVLATDAVGNTEVVIPEAINFENITGIRLLTAEEMAADKRVYTIDGKFVGNTLEGLARGTYIRGGKKVIVK